MLVVQQYPAHVGLSFLQVVQVVYLVTLAFPAIVRSVVMVPSYGVDAVCGMQLRQYLFKSVQFRSPVVHQVTREYD